MSDETVADVLREVCDDECWKMIDRVEMPEMAQPEMDYEDWVRPMKLTGGRVCLRVQRDTEPPVHLRWTPRGLQVHAPDVLAPKPPLAVAHYLKWAMDSPPLSITPVLRADTPFAEGDDG